MTLDQFSGLMFASSLSQSAVAAALCRTHSIKQPTHIIMDCGDKRSAAPLWLFDDVGPIQRLDVCVKLKPKRRRRCALPDALHRATDAHHYGLRRQAERGSALAF